MRITKRRFGVRWLAVGAVAALVLAACGSDEPAATDEPDAPEAAPEPAEEPEDAEEPAADEGPWEPEWVDGVLQPLPDGFPSSQITLLNNKTAGHDDGIYMRALQNALAGTSPVPINVLDRDHPASTWGGLEYILTQEGGTDGYWLTVMSASGTAMDMVTDTEEERLGFDLSAIEPVISTETAPFVLITRADAPWETYEEMMDYGRENPGELRYLARVGSQLDVTMEYLLDLEGVEVQRIPGGATDEIATTVGAGEADFTMTVAGIASTHRDAGAVRTLVVAGDSRISEWPDTPSTADVGHEGVPFGSLRALAVPAEVPELHRQWLFELFKAAAESEPYQNRLDSLPGSEFVLYDGAETRALMDTALESGRAIAEEIAASS